MERKLKPLVTPGRLLGGIFAALLVIGTLLIIRFFYGSDVVFLLGALYPAGAAVWSLVILIRTRNGNYLILLLAMLFFTAANLIRVFYRESVAEYFLFGFFAFFLWFLIIRVKEKLYNPYRKILELAARPVEDARDGFTGRPYPAGFFRYRFEELRKLARYLVKKRIALPYFERDRVVFLLEYSCWHWFGFTRNYQGYTHVIFTRRQEIVVNISRASYQRYRDELTFDRLCASMGEIFRIFLDFSKSNREKEIFKMVQGTRELPSKAITGNQA